MKSEKLLEEFTKYCKDRPELRFWQALRNWSKFNYVSVSSEMEPCETCKDTFYFEGKDK